MEKNKSLLFLFLVVARIMKITDRWKKIIIVALLIVILALVVVFVVCVVVLKPVAMKILKEACPENSEIKDGKCYPPNSSCPAAECTTNAQCSRGMSCLTGSVCGTCTTASDCIDPIQREICFDGVCTFFPMLRST